MNLKDYVTNIKDFPEKGIIFRDITTLIGNGEALKYSVDELSKFAKEKEADLIVGPESRGFIFGTPIASNLGIGFVPVRKPGKLPRETIEASYTLEYGTDKLCMHKDAIKPGQKVIICDDLLATGGTMKAAIELVEQLGGIVVGTCFVIELVDLKGREKLKGYTVKSLISYNGL